jgi:hypothetical protein
MSISKDPIFKSIMFALAVIYIALLTQSVWAAMSVKLSAGPVSVIAGHADFSGRVTTVD